MRRKARPLWPFDSSGQAHDDRAAQPRPGRRKGPGSGALDRTISDVPLKTVYGPHDVAELDLARDLPWPGEYPYTRGIHRNGYRDRLWTMRQFAGFGTAAQTNERYHFLLEHGQHGLSVAFDMPTLMGYDSDAPQARGEVGKCGVAIDSLADMELLFDGIDMGEITTSMTINGPACIALAQYVAAAEKKGIPRARLGGTLQADILKEYIAQKEWIFPPRPHMRIIVDMIEFCTREMPKWNTISISGYHIREAGSTAAQELAFTLADGFAYVEACMAAGMDVDEFAPRLSFFFNSHIDFFEEIAKFRAARRIYARHMREKYGATQSALVAAALPHADGGLQRDGAAAREQHRARRVRGDGRGARRHPVAAHQLDGRSLGAADGKIGRDRAAHATGLGVRNERDQRRRSARRLVLRRGAHRRDGASSRELISRRSPSTAA